MQKQDIEQIKHDILLQTYANAGSLVYILKVHSYKNGNYVIKIGESRSGIKERFKDHKQNYSEYVLLDCFLVQQSNALELSLHKEFKDHKVKNLQGHEKEKELFLIGEHLSYQTVLDTVNQNIKHYNGVNYEHEITLAKLELEKLKCLQGFSSPELIQQSVNGQKEIMDKLNNLEKKIINIENKITAPTTVNGFNEPLGTLGPRLQKINPETLQLVKVYESLAECVKQEQVPRSSIKKAADTNTLYNQFRWQYVDRALDPNTVRELQPTKQTKSKTLGYVAKLNKDKTQILSIYLDKKTASIKNNYPSTGSLDNVVNYDKMSNGHFYMLLNNCPDHLKEPYKDLLLYKQGIGKYNQDGVLVEEFKSKLDCVQKTDIGDKSLSKALETGKPHNNSFTYRYIYDKVQFPEPQNNNIVMKGV